MAFGTPTHRRDSNTRPGQARAGALRRAALSILAGIVFLGLAPAAGAQQVLPLEPDPGGPLPSLSFDSMLGPWEYRAGRGLRVGNTGLTIGGFSVVEFDDPEHEDLTIALDSITFLVLYEPIDQLHFFAEVELGKLAAWDSGTNDFDSNPDAVIERLFGDWARSDALNLRVGKFQTPVGRFNLVPAEPFIWMSTDPVMIDIAFDEHQTGAALFGTLYPGGNPVRYWIYGQMVNPLDADPDAAHRSAGARIEYGSAFESWSIGSSLYASEKKGGWEYLAGLDAAAVWGPLELTTEAVYSAGAIDDRDLWSIYVQGVYDLGYHLPFLQGLYFAGRYEHFDRFGDDNALEIWDVGLTWIPKPWLSFKLGYRFLNRISDDAQEGITASFSVLF